jgi:hypothetical protein
MSEMPRPESTITESLLDKSEYLRAYSRALLEEANVVLRESRRLQMKIRSDKEKLELWRLELRKEIRLRILPPPDA